MECGFKVSNTPVIRIDKRPTNEYHTTMHNVLWYYSNKETSMRKHKIVTMLMWPPCMWGQNPYRRYIVDRGCIDCMQGGHTSAPVHTARYHVDHIFLLQVDDLDHLSDDFL